MAAVASPSPALAAAPHSLFVTVPETTLPNGTVVPSFRVGQYLCSKGPDGRAAVTAEGKPWVEISYRDARQACADAGFALITELQALAIAHSIANVVANWGGRKVRAGFLKQGLRTCLVDEAQPGTYDPTTRDIHEDRWFELANGALICDAAGNAFTWVFDNVQGDENGLVAKPFAVDSPSVTTAPFPSLERGMGWYPRAGANWSGNALVRSGCWGSESDAGVFRLDVGWPGYGSDYVGFRCTQPGP